MGPRHRCELESQLLQQLNPHACVFAWIASDCRRMQSASIASTLRAYAELGRISNLPTTISNVLVGCAIGAASGGAWRWWIIPLLAVAIASFYIAGMALNDLAD